ncbi:MAG: hypothetical protein LBE81_05660 [Azonexus sp.]|jgi:hypothetical protein|uniref:hypothetical protein n=1 Tax=Azonexus sp. TaxID=1872668 RepID=UPI00282CFF2B|nr:hypothetical protein [Azonexus sp.]MDR0776107.1 hypothetical protein [Azonexus sp.]
MVAKEKGLGRRLLGWFGWTVLVLFVLLTLLAATFAYYSQRGPTKAQQAALALLQKDYRPTHGVNAFPLLFYMNHNVPEDRLDAQMAADVERVRKRLDGASASKEAADEDYTDAPKLPELSTEEKAALCAHDGKGCLAQVVAQPEAVRAALAAHPIRVARAQAFEDADYFWNEFPASASSPTVIGDIRDGRRLWLSAFALKYAEGNHVDGLAATCRNLGAWRRMARGTNSLLNRMLADGFRDGAIRLYADMLVALPADEAVPEDCALALQPVVAADADLCPVWAGELAMFESALREADKSSASHGVSASLYPFFDLHKTTAWFALHLSPACGSQANARFLADELPHREELERFPFWTVFSVPPGATWPECMANAVGCVLFNVGADTGKYDARLLGWAARLRLAATLLWLREHSGEGSIAERFEHRPAELRSTNHASGFDAERGVIYVEDSYQSDKHHRFELPVGSLP